MSSRASRSLPASVRQMVRSFDDIEIHFDLYRKDSRGAVLVVPGFWRDRRHPSMIALADRVAAQGYSVAVMDSRGHGASGGMYGFNRHEHEDTAAVASAVLDSLGVDSITFVGLSYGGAIAISTAARHALPVASLLLISPVADFAMIAPRINILTMHRHIALSQALRRPRFDWRARGTEKIRALDDVDRIGAPLGLIHVKDDWLVGHDHSAALYARASEPKELHLIDVPGNYHADRLFSAVGDRVGPIMSRFLERYTPR